MIIILLTLLFVFFPSPAFSLDECPFRIQPRIVFDGRASSFVVKACGAGGEKKRAERRGCAILSFHHHRLLSPAYSRRVFRDGYFRPFRIRLYGFTYECDQRSQLRFGVFFYVFCGFGVPCPADNWGILRVSIGGRGLLGIFGEEFITSDVCGDLGARLVAFSDHCGIGKGRVGWAKRKRVAEEKRLAEEKKLTIAIAEASQSITPERQKEFLDIISTYAEKYTNTKNEMKKTYLALVGLLNLLCISVSCVSFLSVRYPFLYSYAGFTVFGLDTH